MKNCLSFVRDDSGATAIEYGLIAAIIGVGIITVLKGVRSQLQGAFDIVNTELAGAAK